MRGTLFSSVLCGGPFVRSCALCILPGFRFFRCSSDGSPRSLNLSKQPIPFAPDRANQRMIGFSHLRRFQLINLSLQKTGTKSIYGVFGNYRSAHEFQHDEATTALSAFHSGTLDEVRLRAYLATRDAIGQLEVDSASFNVWFAKQYITLFPNALFLIVLRHPVDWLDSVLTHIRRDVRHTLQEGQPYPDRFKRQAELAVGPFAPEVFLDDNNLAIALPELSQNLLAYWKKQNRLLIEAVPPVRRLILSTENLSRSLVQLAGFVGVPVDTLIPGQSHLHRKPEQRSVLQGFSIALDTEDSIETWKVWEQTLIEDL